MRSRKGPAGRKNRLRGNFTPTAFLEEVANKEYHGLDCRRYYGRRYGYFDCRPGRRFPVEDVRSPVTSGSTRGEAQRKKRGPAGPRSIKGWSNCQKSSRIDTWPERAPPKSDPIVLLIKPKLGELIFMFGSPRLVWFSTLVNVPSARK